MFNSVNKKLLGIVALLLTCTCVLGGVALWGTAKQKTLLAGLESNIQDVFTKSHSLGIQLDETIDNSDRMGEMAAQVGKQFKAVQVLMDEADDSAAHARKYNISSLTTTALQLLDLKIDSAKFLADASVKSKDVRESAAGFYIACMEDYGITVKVDSPPPIIQTNAYGEQILQQVIEESDPYDDQGIVNDFISALVSSANANFYVVLGLEGEFEGKGMFSNDSEFFETNLKNTYLYSEAIKENRLSKSIDLLGNELTLSSAAFMKTDSGRNIGLLIAGYRLDLAALRFLSKDLNANLSLFVADENGNINNAKFSTLVNSEGNLLTDFSLPKGLLGNFSKRLEVLTSEAQAKGTSVDGKANRSDFIDIRENDIGGIVYTTAYQALLTDNGKLIGVLAVSRDCNVAVIAQNQIVSTTTLAVENVDKAEQSRVEIAKANAKGKVEAETILKATTEAEVQLQESLETASILANKTEGTTIISFLVSLSIGIFATFLIVLKISRPLIRTADLLKDISEGDGDLTKRLEVRTSDEVGRLAEHFNNFIIKLQKMIGDISNNAETLGSSAEVLSDLSGNMSKNSDSMFSKSNTVAAAAEEMNANMNSVAAASEQASANIEMVATATEEMTCTISEIAKNAENASTITNGAVQQASSASDKIDELGSAAQKIGKVTEAINEISDQINLLALNATIEAARAGEAGKGFAVVANEIKELAKQTTEATNNIEEGIDAIQTTTKVAVSEMKEISIVIKDVNEIVSTIATSVEEQSVTTQEIAGNVAQASNGIQEVNENVAQSSTVSGEIAHEISNVNQSVREMSDSSSKVNGNAEELSKLSELLTEMVGRFRV